MPFFVLIKNLSDFKRTSASLIDADLEKGMEKALLELNGTMKRHDIHIWTNLEKNFKMLRLRGTFLLLSLIKKDLYWCLSLTNFFS